MTDVILLHVSSVPKYQGTLFLVDTSVQVVADTVEHAEYQLRSKVRELGGNLVLGLGFAYSSSGEGHKATTRVLAYGTVFKVESMWALLHSF